MTEAFEATGGVGIELDVGEASGDGIGDVIWDVIEGPAHSYPQTAQCHPHPSNYLTAPQ